MRSADALSAFAHYTPAEVAAGLSGLENREGVLRAEVLPIPINTNSPAEATDGPRSPGEVAFRILGDWAISMGYGTPEGVEAVAKAIYGGGR
jgi:hypothetical protein